MSTFSPQYGQVIEKMSLASRSAWSPPDAPDDQLEPRLAEDRSQLDRGVALVAERADARLVRRRYRLTALSERAAPISADVTSVQGLATAPDLQLDESTWKFTQHKNKFGQDYPAAAYNR